VTSSASLSALAIQPDTSAVSGFDIQLTGQPGRAMIADFLHLHHRGPGSANPLICCSLGVTEF
jgi:hypothetical protein